MERITLSLGMGNNLRSRPIFEGRVKADGIDLVCSDVYAGELFWRQLKHAEFDVAEMSLSSLLIAVANGDRRFVGLPIFTVRRFFHTMILVRRDAGIETPADLKGKRVGVPEYQQTAALWSRGVLMHEFGVEPRDMTFWMERTPDVSHGGTTGFRPPPGVVVNQIPKETNIGEMLMAGELDATLLYLPIKSFTDRSREDLSARADIGPLFRDPRAEGIRYFRKTGIFPINHGMVVRREIAERHPWVIINVYNAFRDANALVDADRAAHLDYLLATGHAEPEAATVKLAPYGVRENRDVLETVAQYSHEQGLTPRRIGLDELFAKNTLEL